MKFMNFYISFRDYWGDEPLHAEIVSSINEWVIATIDPKDYQWAYAKFMFREKHRVGIDPNPLGLSLQNEGDLLAFKIKFGHLVTRSFDETGWPPGSWD
jgi:hypothetical protein